MRIKENVKNWNYQKQFISFSVSCIKRSIKCGTFHRGRKTHQDTSDVFNYIRMQAIQALQHGYETAYWLHYLFEGHPTGLFVLESIRVFIQARLWLIQAFIQLLGRWQFCEKDDYIPNSSLLSYNIVDQTGKVSVVLFVLCVSCTTHLSRCFFKMVK